ncbi:Nucleotidyl transferase [Candidatus Koribacter versatilis Ellin345]|uniref:Nucleotidyl transferase n=1 Tax=Koribacter versatilis (strain Ellin345) TaxID=204669 RepID=Q1IJL2_KORVE|nr:nucleotidyltransferase family protein [Candidatus Koribacter versatilis]ABF42938.1 Nucleotidyl transferase [Candidatus Koribacter versatilis Ellin345]
MKAMVLAAGLGTRLRPLTDDRPKALVELNGRALLEITLTRLRSYGIREVIINVHHFADQVVDYLRAHDNFGMTIEISREAELLDTGGGLKRAAHLFLRDSNDEPFVLHNVDILTNIDLEAMLRFHREHQALATLAVKQRPSSRQLLFDANGQLCGRRNGHDAAPEIVRPSETAEELGFCGIHILSPNILPRLDDAEIFSIIPTYLRVAAAGEPIVAFRADSFYWRDVGSPASLREAATEVARNNILPS